MSRAAAYQTGGRRCRGLAIAGQAKASETLKRNASIAFGSCKSGTTVSTWTSPLGLEGSLTNPSTPGGRHGTQTTPETVYA